MRRTVRPGDAWGPGAGPNRYHVSLALPSGSHCANRTSESFAGVTYMYSRRRVGLSGEIYFVALRFTVECRPGGNMAPLRPGLTPVRRAVGVAAVLFLLGCAVVFYRAAPGFPTSGSRPGTTANSSSAGSSRASQLPPTISATPGGVTSSSSAAKSIQVEDSAYSAKPFQTVRIQGTYRGGPNTFLQVQRLEQGKWLSFPLPTKTDDEGRFTAYVELGQPGGYWLRMLDPGSGVASQTFAVMIKA
jgi:hypothetical protein